MKRIVLAVVLFAASIGAGPCGGPESPDDLPGTGVVHQGIAPECPNVWRVDTADGKKLWPVEDAGFQVEGLEVAFSAHEQQGMVSICMAGTMVKFDAMRKK